MSIDDGTIDDSAVVVVVDLRDPKVLQRALTVPIEQIQREYREQLGRVVDVGRLLAIDHTSQMMSHAALLAGFSGANSVSNTLVLAVGPRHGGGTELALPGINSQELPVLWAGDMVGIGWSPSLGGRVFGDPDHAARNDAGLVRALSVPSVFDRVHKQVAAMPHSVATPAIKIILGEIGQEVLDRAKGMAFDQFTRPASGIGDLPVPDEARKVRQLLTGDATQDLAGIGNIVDPNGALGHAAMEARRHLGAAGDLLDTLRQEPFTGSRPAPGGGTVPAGQLIGEELVRAGTNLAGLAGTLTAALKEIGGITGQSDKPELAAALRDMIGLLTDSGSSPQAGVDKASLVDSLRSLGQSANISDGAALAILGVRSVPVPAAEPAAVRRALRELTDVALAHRVPLAGIAQWLRDLATHARPVGSATAANQVDQVCPPQRVQTLRTPPRFPFRFGAGGLTTAFASTFLAALWGAVGIAVALLAIAIIIGLVVRLYQRRPVPWPRQRQDIPDLSRLHLAWGTGCALAGGIAGAAVGRDVDWAAPPAVKIICLLAGLLLAWAPLLWWRLAVDAWRERLQLLEAAADIDALGKLLGKLALNEWVLMNARLGGGRLALALAVAMDGARETLNQLRPVPSGQGPFPAPQPSSQPTVLRTPRDRGPALGVSHAVSDLIEELIGELTKIVVDDTAAAIRTVVSDSGEEIAQWKAEDIRLRVGGALKAVMTGYSQHLRIRGPLSDPGFGASSRLREKFAEQVWARSNALQMVGGTDVDDRWFLQLSSPADLSLLNQTSSAAELVRFIPRSARPAPAEETGRPDIAGVIRLIPLDPRAARRGAPPADPHRDAPLGPTPSPSPSPTPTPTPVPPPMPAPPAAPPAVPAPAPPGPRIPQAPRWAPEDSPATPRPDLIEQHQSDQVEQRRTADRASAEPVAEPWPLQPTQSTPPTPAVPPAPAAGSSADGWDEEGDLW